MIHRRWIIIFDTLNIRDLLICSLLSVIAEGLSEGCYGRAQFVRIVWMPNLLHPLGGNTIQMYLNHFVYSDGLNLHLNLMISHLFAICLYTKEFSQQDAYLPAERWQSMCITFLMLSGSNNPFEMRWPWILSGLRNSVIGPTLWCGPAEPNDSVQIYEVMEDMEFGRPKHKKK